MDLEVMVFSPLEISGKISTCENTVASTKLFARRDFNLCWFDYYRIL
jgi:hypothetical protein